MACRGPRTPRRLMSGASSRLHSYFSQVIFHVAIDVEMSWPRRVRASPRVKEIDLANKPRRRFPALVVARIVYALLLVFFCLIYWAVVLVDKNRGEMEHEF
nr:uncharacterized protein LOC113804628 [Penaeus vannamei]